MKGFSVVESVQHLTAQYRSFIKSSYRLADPHLRDQFEQHVNGADVLVKGPYVTLARDFAPGKPLAEVLADGAGHRDLARLKWPFGKHPLFAHQEKALRTVESGRNVIVKTGTGSGKTEAFLLPVLSGVLKLREQGVAGTKAILLYPMNALANDQLGRMRDLLRDSGSPITFYLYTGDSDAVSTALGEPLEGNELRGREAARQNPPDIILTNYKQLEYLLVRKSDRVLFTPALRHLVLDEIHSYRGALASEMACLIRRLKARCGLKAGELRCLGTSATVSQDAGGDAALARFARDLFAEPFDAANIVGEAYVPHAEPAAPYMPPLARLSSKELATVKHDDAAALVALAEQLCGRRSASGGGTYDKIRALLDGNQFIEALREAGKEPRSPRELAEVLCQKLPALTELDADHLQRLIAVYLLIGSYGDDQQPPVLRPKLHSFFHGVYDVGLCMNPDCRKLLTDGADHCPDCESAVRPAVLCRTCGQDFVKVRFDPEHQGLTVPNDDFVSDDDTAFITPRLIGERDEDADRDDEEEDAEESERPKRRRKTAAQQKLTQEWVDHLSGRVHESRPADVPSETLSRQYVMRRKGSTCPVCNARYARGDVLTLLRTGVASSVSVLGTHHLDTVPDDQRKLLVFADNRQDAAHQAGYMGDRHRQFALRHAIEAAVRDAGPDGIGLESLPHAVFEIFKRIGLARRNPSTEENKFWLRTLSYECASEFCRTSHQRIALENLALVEVRYEFLDGLAADARFVDACKRAAVTPENGIVLVRAILDFMRRKRAVSFDFYGDYLNPTRAPWSFLTGEPYNLSVPEHERGATAFMFDRPEVARSKPVSGVRFEALVKDSARGPGGGVVRLVCNKGGLGDEAGETWTRVVFGLLREYEIAEPVTLPERVRRSLGSGTALQVSKRAVKLTSGAEGWRCRKCSIWRPYRDDACYATTSCSGRGEDLLRSTADYDNYYVSLYTQDRPRRLRALEHTAQIDQEARAKREQEFKDGRVEALVCSPTLELGVNIGDLYSVLLRNAPPAPANYIQRAGRAGRRLRIGFVSTFCGMSPHDRHCFEDPSWLVRGEFRPPVVRMDNDKIIARHIRSFALEELDEDFSWLMGDLLEDEQNPEKLNEDRYRPLTRKLREQQAAVRQRAALTFGKVDGIDEVVMAFPSQIELTIQQWHAQVQRLHREFTEYSRIVQTRESEQKRRARMRAYFELTNDRQKAFGLTYFADVGLLPSYQFPTDTFSLDPGVADTPTLRRPAWIALFEFAPGNMVYANGHKLKTIRAFFEGGARSSAAERGADQSGRVETHYFCEPCGLATTTVLNDCPKCHNPIRRHADVALIDSFEAEENTQITSAEDSRQRVTFDRKEHLLDDGDAPVMLYPYEFSALEFRAKASLLVTNWGRQKRWGGEGEPFELCPNCGRHRPHGLNPKAAARWDENHQKICNGSPRAYVLGYRFHADALILPVVRRLIPHGEVETKAFCRTLGKALVVGAQEMLEIEPDEVAYFQHGDGSGGKSLVFYETAPGGAGYLEQLAKDLPRWIKAAHERLFGHVCERACYRCLKSSRNQMDHALLDKELIRSVLFQLGESRPTAEPRQGRRGEGQQLTERWLDQELPPAAAAATRDTPIELRLLEAIREGGRLPEPVSQHEFRGEDGALLTVADFAFPEQRIAIYCDGFAYHGNVDALSRDALKRNELQGRGWSVLTFWGKQILRNPASCENQVWRCFESRRVRSPG